MMPKHWKTFTYGRGFTIVELLIVVVVISILAVIAVVAFNGVQTRAKLAALGNEMNTITNKLEVFNVDRMAYPQSITDCPIPAATAICLTPGGENAYRYQAYTPAAPGWMILNNNAYEIAVLGTSHFLYSSNAERRSTNEFVQYTDMGPIIDKYGLVRYQIDFDIRSANTATQSSVNVYFQNGSTARYGGLSQNVTVTTEFTHKTITFTPAMNNSAVAASMLAFYGTYATGNVPTIRNVQIKLAP